MYKATISSCLLLVSVWPVLAAGVDSQNIITSYQRVLQRELERLQDEHALKVHRLGRLQGLAERGHATWLEIRKQKLEVDQLEAKAKIFADFAECVEGMDFSGQEIEFWGVLQQPTAALNFTDISFKYGAPTQEHTLQSLRIRADHLRIDLAQKKKVVQQLVQQTGSLSDTDSWKPWFKLKLRISRADAALCDSRLALIDQLVQGVRNESVSISKRLQTPICRATIGTDLRESTLDQVALHGRLIQHQLTSERQRIASLKELQNRSAESTRDLRAVTASVERLQSLLDLQQQVSEFLTELEPDSTRDDSVRHDSSGNSLCEATNTAKLGSLSLVFLRHEARSQYLSAKLRMEMLGEVLSRLERSANSVRKKATDGSRMRTVLTEIQDNELNGYRQRIEFESLKMKLALARINTLSNEETIYATWFENIANRNASPLETVSYILPIAIRAPLTNSILIIPKEPDAGVWNNLGTFDYAINPGECFPVSFRMAGLEYGPTLLSDYRQRSGYRYRSHSSRSSLDSASRFNVGSLSQTLAARPSHERESSPTRRPLKTYGRAYDNGMIRSELRPFLNPGQPPWYLPGSPTNLRLQQLRTNHQSDTFGRSGNELLRSKIFTDVYGR